MTAEAFDQSLDLLFERQPFQPFTICLQNGERHEVDHPRAFAYRGGIAFYSAPGGVPHLFDHESVTQLIGDLKTKAQL
jgi:hypothetical protein